MKKLAAVVMVALLFTLVLAPTWGLQDGDKCTCKEIAGEHSKKDHKRPPGPPPPDGKDKHGPPDGKRHGPPDGGEKKGPPPGAKDGDKHDGKCGGKDGAGVAEELRKRKDLTPQEIEGYVKLHFKLNHEDGGCCHCFCGHKPPPPPEKGEGGKKPGRRDDDDDKKPEQKCGKDKNAYADDLRRKEYSKDEIERIVKEHFKKHSDGCCHCSCNHDDDSGKKDGGKESGGKDNRKGNNGVGNGVDPQPPGNPPVNDGPGTGPGNPGNKKKGGDGKGGDGKKS